VCDYAREQSCGRFGPRSATGTPAESQIATHFASLANIQDSSWRYVPMTTSIRFAGVGRYQESIRGLCGAMLIALAMAIPARADSIGAYTLFAGHAIQATGGITATAGVIGSNGDMYLNGATAQTVRGGGSIFDVFGGVTTTGDVTVNGNAQLTFFGGIGGNLNVGQNAYTSTGVRLTNREFV
jgi:hypothetical protein